jgi:hypothetical protein
VAQLDQPLRPLDGELGDDRVVLGGRSKVEAMTSPFTDRCMSVTSSGRSSTRTTMRWLSGLFLVIALAMAWSTIVLPAFGGDTIRPRWPFPSGATRSMTAS